MSRTSFVHDPLADQRFLEAVAAGEGSWRVPVTSRLLTPLGGLYGGAGIAAAVAALEATTGRALRWITCQFVASAVEGETLDVCVEVDVHGHRTTQANVRASVGDRLVLRALAALGEARADAPGAAWVEMPDVPGPEECTDHQPPFPTERTFMEHTRRRLARGPAGEDFLTDEPRSPGFHMCLWSRIIDHTSTSAAMLAWLADIVPMGVAAGLGAGVRGTSLDNTLRLGEPARADWVLVDVRPTAAAAGYAHGDVYLWAPDGRLLASGSQTAVLRRRRW